MKNFKINEEQIHQIANALLEFPAKNVLSSLDILRNLPVLFEKVNVTEEEKKPD